jgi:hypothetical protein
MLEVFPNPNNGVFNLKLPFNCTTTVYDVLGRIILSATEKKSGLHQLDISDRDNGLYFLEITGGSKQLRVALVKQ